MRGPIPAGEYSGDERAERARGAGLALLILAAAAVLVPVAVVLAIWVAA